MVEQIDKSITERWINMDYRPTGVAVIYNKESNVLLAKTAVINPSTLWSFPQGGIEENETLNGGLLRELKEEIGIVSPEDLEIKNHAFYQQSLNAESGRIDKRGFTKGKDYIFSLFRYNGNGNFTLNPKELLEVRWVNFNEAMQLFELGREDKAQILKEALRQSSNLINLS